MASRNIRMTKFGCAFIGAVFFNNCASFDYEPLSVTIENNQIIASGVIDESTPDVLGNAIRLHPNAKTLVLQNVPGSADDISNLKIARKIRSNGLITVIPADGMVASGGTDLFLAGKIREIEQGACIGVHSWAGGSLFKMVEGSDIAKNHPEHEKYLSYYRDMDIDTEFYWYTLDAADADDLHWMTPLEIEKFNVGTIVASNSTSQPTPADDCWLRAQ